MVRFGMKICDDVVARATVSFRPFSLSNGTSKHLLRARSHSLMEHAIKVVVVYR